MVEIIAGSKEKKEGLRAPQFALNIRHQQYNRTRNGQEEEK
jgi:hypothetical protein